MRDETATWLAPMTDEAERRGIFIPDLMKQATMSAAEAGSASLNWIAGYMPPEARLSAIDWIRFGQLLRDELGWQNYPHCPADMLS